MVHPTLAPAFAGASFDSTGGCLSHPEVKLAQRTTIDGGKVVYKELRRTCPKCMAGSNNSSSGKNHEKQQQQRKQPDERRPSIGSTSTGAQASTRSSSKPRSSSRSRTSSHHANNGGGNHSNDVDSKSTSGHRLRRPSLGRSKPAKKYDTPFDSKGRCHYHSNMQLAKKKLTGGWKVSLRYRTTQDSKPFF